MKKKMKESQRERCEEGSRSQTDVALSQGMRAAFKAGKAKKTDSPQEHLEGI